MRRTEIARAATAVGLLLLLGCRDQPDTEAVRTNIVGVGAKMVSVFAPYAPERVHQEITKRATIENGALIREDLRFKAPDGEWATAIRLRPQATGLYPGVLVLHGHDPGAERPAERFIRGLPLQLAKKGFVTLTPDVRSFGHFKPKGHNHNRYARIVKDEGDVYLRLVVNDARHATKVLLNSQGVDAQRVGIAGVSLGGLTALLTASVEPKLQAVVVSNMLVPFSILFSRRHHFCQHLLPLERHAETYEIAASLLPRALQIQWGSKDNFYNNDNGKFATAHLEDVAEILGHQDALEVVITPGEGHQMDIPQHLDFLTRRLGSTPSENK